MAFSEDISGEEGATGRACGASEGDVFGLVALPSPLVPPRIRLPSFSTSIGLTVEVRKRRCGKRTGLQLQVWDIPWSWTHERGAAWWEGEQWAEGWQDEMLSPGGGQGNGVEATLEVGWLGSRGYLLEPVRPGVWVGTVPGVAQLCSARDK